MLLIQRKTQTTIIAEVLPLTAKDLKDIKKGKQFSFNWEQEKTYDLYKLVLQEKKEIVGLMSIIYIPKELRLEIHLLELSKENVGSEKRLERIAGCLIAYACKLSFSKDYDGFVSLIPKTMLVEHYQKKYGFRPFGGQLAVFGKTSENLIQKFL